MAAARVALRIRLIFMFDLRSFHGVFVGAGGEPWHPSLLSVAPCRGVHQLDQLQTVQVMGVDVVSDGPAVGGEVNGIGGGVFQEGEPQTDLLQFQLSQKVIVPVVCQQDALIEIGRIPRPQENLILGIRHICIIYIHGHLHRLRAGGLVVFTQSYSGAVIVQHVVKVYHSTVPLIPIPKNKLNAPGL